MTQYALDGISASWSGLFNRVAKIERWFLKLKGGVRVDIAAKISQFSRSDRGSGCRYAEEFGLSAADHPRRARKVFRKEMSRDTVAALKRAGVIAAGPRSPELGAPYTYATTATFRSVFGLASLGDLEKLEDAGLLTKADLLAGEIPMGIGDGPSEEDPNGDTIDDPDAVDGLEP